MGSIWLYDLPDVLADAGLDITTYAGWETRARSSGGYDGVYAIGIHHDASAKGSSDQSAWDWAWKNSSDRPIGAIRLSRSGLVCIGAAGATNTMGKGGPLTTSRGTVPQDAGNKYMIAIEAGNNGTGESWSTSMVDAYVRMCRALCDAYGLDARRDIFTHHSYCEPSTPGRKVDPAGPTPGQPSLGGTSGCKIWSHDDFRDLVCGVTPQPPEPGPEPEPTPPPDGEDWMVNLPTIKKGSSGPYVERMQHLLAAAGYMNPTNGANYDGVWGNGTDDAKRRFDNDHGLTPSPPTDCGSKSWESLMTGKKW
jgi:N-acetylmuramoyl-L-alanine amidase